MNGRCGFSGRKAAQPIFAEIGHFSGNRIAVILRMKREEFLNLRQMPYRLTPEQVGFILDILPHHIAILIAAGFLKPLGHPPENGHKFFHLPEILELAEDRRRMAQLSDLLVNTWRAKNLKARQAAQEIFSNNQNLSSWERNKLSKNKAVSQTGGQL